MTICIRHDQILQSVKTLQRTLDTLIRESRSVTPLLQEVASSHLEILEDFHVLEDSCFAGLEAKLLVTSKLYFQCPRDHKLLALIEACSTSFHFYFTF